MPSIKAQTVQDAMYATNGKNGWVNTIIHLEPADKTNGKDGTIAANTMDIP